jgi:AcrR family transcriptional regulator
LLVASSACVEHHAASQPPTVGDVARERILAATERCVDRYGLRKTTIDDVACEVGLSRPSIYRYFVDRDDLLIELITRHARALIKRTHRATSWQSSPSDQLIESILYIGELARRDSLTRHVLDPDSTNLGRRMIASGRSETIRADLFDPYLDAAVANNELPLGLPRPDAHMWLGHVVKMVMRGLDDGEGDLERYRSILRRFVAPALSAQTPKRAPEQRHAVAQRRNRHARLIDNRAAKT